VHFLTLTKMDWMYDGKSSALDREAYLLGKPITKSENEGDSCVKDRTEDVSVLERLDYESKLREDPLIAIRKKEDTRRRELLSNPVKRKHLQVTLKLALEKELGHKKKDKCGHTPKKAERLHDVKDAENAHYRHKTHKLPRRQLNSEIILKNARTDKHLQKILKTALEDDLKNNLRHASPDSSSDESCHKQKHCESIEKSAVEASFEKPSSNKTDAAISKSSMKKISSACSSSASSSSKPSGYGLIVKHNCPTRVKQSSQKKDLEPVKVRYHRKERKGFTKNLSKKELERKRKEMMDNAGWRDEQRKKNVDRYKAKEAIDIEKEKHIMKLCSMEEKKYGKVKTFLHDEKLKRTMSGSVEDTVRRKRHTLAKNDG